MGIFEFVCRSGGTEGGMVSIPTQPTTVDSRYLDFGYLE